MRKRKEGADSGRKEENRKTRGREEGERWEEEKNMH